MQQSKQAVRFTSIQKRFWEVSLFLPTAVLVSVCLGVPWFLLLHVSGAQDTKLTNAMVLLQENTPPGKRIAYGQDPYQFGELRLPDAGAKFPVAILVHGGCWSAKLKIPAEATSLNLLRPLSAALAQAGIASWNIEYRRLGNPGAGWPGSYEDLAQATDFLRMLAPTYNLDLTKVIVIGHSSGGQLALWVAARQKLPRSSALYKPSPLSIAGAVDVEGPPDIQTALSWDQRVCSGPVVQQFMGGLPAEVPSHYKEGSAGGLLPIGVRQELLYAAKNQFMADDEKSWADQFTSYAALATRSGDRARAQRMENAGHFDGIDPQSSTWPEVLSSIRSLLQQK
jgi:acetyl esterase/lipase